MSTLPNNAHVSTHPCLKAKLSLLRSVGTSSRDVQTLVHEIALMVGYEALASGLKTKDIGTVRSYPKSSRLPWLPEVRMIDLPAIVMYPAIRRSPTMHSIDTTHAMPVS